MTKTQVMHLLSLPTPPLDNEWVSLHSSIQKSDKVYIMAVCGDILYTGYGRRGGRLSISNQTKVGPLFAMKAMMRSKFKKGYVAVGGFGIDLADVARGKSLPVQTKKIDHAPELARSIARNNVAVCVNW
jgi:hypothetical protein